MSANQMWRGLPPPGRFMPTMQPAGWVAGPARAQHVHSAYATPLFPFAPLSASFNRLPDSPRNRQSPQKPKVDETCIQVEDVADDVVEETTVDAVVEEEEQQVEVEVELTPEEQLSKAFYAIAEDGVVTLAHLPSLLDTMNMGKSPQEVQQAIQKIIPDADCDTAQVTFEVALAVYQELCNISVEVESVSSGGEQHVVTSVQNRSLCLLVTTVVAVIFVCASTVGGLAIFWLWTTSLSGGMENLNVDLLLMQDLLQVMLHEEHDAQKQQLALDFAVTIGELVQEVGYGLDNLMGHEGLLTSTTFLSHTVDWMWKSESQQTAMDASNTMAEMVEMMVNAFGLDDACALVERMNNGSIAEGHELVIGQWADDTNTSVHLLTKFRYADQCVGGVCAPAAAIDLLMQQGLQGMAGAMVTVDYRSEEVLASTRGILSANIAIVYMVDLDIILEAFLSQLGQLADHLNANATDGREILIARITKSGKKKFLTKLFNCEGKCLADAEQQLMTGSTAMVLALQGKSGIMENVDYRGLPVIAAYTWIPSCRIGLVLKVSLKEFKDNNVAVLGQILNRVNKKFASSEELELTTSKVVNGKLQLVNLTEYRFADGCPQGQCVTSAYMKLAAATCSSGALRSTDYRGSPVTAGYTCMPELNSYVAFSVDQEEVDKEGIGTAVASLNDLNNGNDMSFEMELGQPLPGIGRYDVSEGVNKDFSILTKLKFGAECASWGCTGVETCMQAALHSATGTKRCLDYRNAPVLAATGYIEPMQLGIVAEEDESEILRPAIQTALILVGVSLAALVSTTVLLTWYMRAMVKSMAIAEEEGQAAIRLEKQHFSDLVENMYPTYLLSRVLAGEKHIVQMIPHTAVFFSDIFNFTGASGRLRCEELLELMGYIYGVMDKVAGYFHITKVKTIGDAYLAVSGLPGSESRNCCLDMMRFASCVAQFFSGKFDHPSEGEVLQLFLPRKRVNREKRGDISGSGSAIQSSHPSHHLSAAASSAPTHSAASRSIAPSDSVTHSSGSNAALDPYAQPGRLRCIMSYGIAAGPVTAGVLQGKSPMFDIWGKTVNLASRMQSTGQPGRIQVSELFYKSIMACPVQNYTFEDSHQTVCKGFGLVKCYFVKCTTEGPPEDLLAALGLDANLGTFFFECLVPNLKHTPEPAPPPVVVRETSEPQKSTQLHRHATQPVAHRRDRPVKDASSATTPANVGMSLQMNPKVIHRHEPLSLLEIEE